VKYPVRLLTLLLALPAAMSSHAQQIESGDPLFADNEIFDVTLRAPLRILVRERPIEGYLPGVFSHVGADGTTTSLDVGIRTRGHFRNDNCDFPPLRLNFKKSAVRGTLFDGQDKLKLVVHCDNSVRFEQYVVREYLAYRVLNLFTDKSFRARLMRVTYVDDEGRRNEQVRYAFFIEHKKRLAKRIGTPVLNVEETDVSALDGKYLNLTSVFQYFIANTDFSPIAGPPDSNCCHNYVLFKDDSGPTTAIPYDFDQSGFVDAPYASPDSRLRIRDVTQRKYRGRCQFNEYVDGSVAEFAAKRDAVYGLVETQEGLDDRVKKKLRRFIDRFYAVIDDPGKLQREFIDDCRG